VGFGVVLHKGDALVTFSRPIAPRHVNLAGYKRELIGLIQAVWHLRSYLWGLSWCVRTISFSSYFVTNTSPQFLNMSGQASSWDLILGWNTNRVPQTPLSTLYRNTTLRFRRSPWPYHSHRSSCTMSYMASTIPTPR
jgi:hypothetical protein